MIRRLFLSLCAAFSYATSTKSKCGRPAAAWGVVVFVVAMLVRLALVLPNRQAILLERPEPVQIALSLVATGRYADAYGVGSGPTAHCVPLHPMLLSVLFGLFGTGAQGTQAMNVFGLTAAAVGFALLPALAVAAGLRLSSGVLAGFVGALAPVNFWAQTSGSFDAPLTSVVLVALCILLSRVWAEAQFTRSEGGGIRSSGRSRLSFEFRPDPGSGRMVGCVRRSVPAAIAPCAGVSRHCFRTRPVDTGAVGLTELQGTRVVHLDPFQFRAGIAGLQQ